MEETDSDNECDNVFDSEAVCAGEAEYVLEKELVGSEDSVSDGELLGDRVVDGVSETVKVGVRVPPVFDSVKSTVLLTDTVVG